MTESAPAPAPESTPSARPTGVTILAVLAAISGVLGLLASLALLGLSGLAAATGLGGFAAILGLLTLVYSVLALAFAYGAWTLKPWAWPLGVGAMGLSVLSTLLSLATGAQEIVGAIISLAIAGVVIYYLFTPTVKAAFGRA
jgi:hypothetical protein